MNLERELKHSLKENSKQIVPPQYLKQRVMDRIEDMNGVRKVKSRLIAGILAAALLIPTGAIGYQAYLADDLYGSFDNLKKYFASATMEGYMTLNAKLAQAKGELGKEEYILFKEQLKVITGSKVEYGDQYGNIDFDTIPQEKVQEIKQAMMVLQPYFDQLNGQQSSKEILSPEEYETYIDALMNYEKILVKSAINPSDYFEDADILPEWLEKFKEARNIIGDVDDKINYQMSESRSPIPTFSINNQELLINYMLLPYSSSEVDLQKQDLFTEFEKGLDLIEVEPQSSLDIMFDKQLEHLKVQIFDQSGMINTESTEGTIQLPNEQGEYLIIVSGQWNQQDVTYLFSTKVNK